MLSLGLGLELCGLVNITANNWYTTSVTVTCLSRCHGQPMISVLLDQRQSDVDLLFPTHHDETFCHADIHPIHLHTQTITLCFHSDSLDQGTKVTCVLVDSSVIFINGNENIR